jgi:hypothetical protein
MNAPAKVDRMLSNSIDAVAASLDKLASELCEMDSAERERILPRLRRIAADFEVLVADAARQRARPAESH